MRRLPAPSFPATLMTMSRTTELIAMSGGPDERAQLGDEALHRRARRVAARGRAREVISREQRVGKALDEREVEAFGEIRLAQVERRAVRDHSEAQALEVAVHAVAEMHVGV